MATQVSVKIPTGKVLQIDVEPTKNTCLDLKHKITAALGSNKEKTYYSNQQILSFSSTMLEDSKKLSDYNIQQGSTISISIKPPPKDILNFDECAKCHCQAIDPRALPCGHSCCIVCIPENATGCPVDGCSSPLQPLRPNWLATQFFEAKDAQPSRMCQGCAEEGTQRAASHWCESCSKVSSMEFYCDECVVTEHSSRSSKNHTRVSIEQISSRASLPMCPKHNLHQDLFCFDEGIILCYRCRDEDHASHKTKLIASCEKEIKDDIKILLDAMSEVKDLQAQSSDLKISKKQKQDEVAKLQAEINGIDAKLKKIDEDTIKCTMASAVLTKLVDGCPVQDLFDAKKLKILKTRVDETLKILNKEPSAKATEN